MDLYNAGVAKGVDEEFQKGSNYLATIDKPPFAAYDMGTNSASYFLPLGGLKIDKNASVLSAATGAPIAGLYSAGRNACAIFGDYMGSGTSVVETLIFGRIAGQSAAAAEPSE
ncbi:MAG: FAD-binding protein [Coriobacteriia bacterium]